MALLFFCSFSNLVVLLSINAICLTDRQFADAADTVHACSVSAGFSGCWHFPSFCSYKVIIIILMGVTEQRCIHCHCQPPINIPLLWGESEKQQRPSVYTAEEHVDKSLYSLCFPPSAYDSLFSYQSVTVYVPQAFSVDLSLISPHLLLLMLYLLECDFPLFFHFFLSYITYPQLIVVWQTFHFPFASKHVFVLSFHVIFFLNLFSKLMSYIGL